MVRIVNCVGIVLMNKMNKEKQEIMSADGHAIDGDDMHWTVNCPTCEQELEYTGYYDSGDTNKCKCGTEFKTRRVYFDNGSYME